MFDPAVMGTLLIGLNAERVDRQENRRRPQAAPSRRERVGLRPALARGLRRVAAMLEQPTVHEVTN